MVVGFVWVPGLAIGLCLLLWNLFVFFVFLRVFVWVFKMFFGFYRVLEVCFCFSCFKGIVFLRVLGAVFILCCGSLGSYGCSGSVGFRVAAVPAGYGF